MNKQTLAIAEKVRLERLHQLQNESFVIKKPIKMYLSFNTFFLELWEKRKTTGVNFASWDSVYKQLNNFNKKVLFTEITERLLEEFKSYLL